MKKINCIRTTLEMEEVNDDNDEDKQEQSSHGVEEGENSSQNEPEIRTQASGENGEKLCSLTTYLLN